MNSLIRIGDILAREKRPVTLTDEGEFPLAGVRLNGLGAFLRERKLGTSIRKKDHTQLKEGDIVYNKLFAWRGTFAIVSKEVDGCYVSDKFPIYRLNTRDVMPAFLELVFQSQSFAKQAEKRSVGLAAMSKFTLNPPKFLELEFFAFPLERQRQIVDLARSFADQSLRMAELTVEVDKCARACLAQGTSSLTKGVACRKLGELGEAIRRSVNIVDHESYRQITIGMNNRGIRLRGEKLGGAIAVKNQAIVKKGDVLFSRIDIRNGAIGIVPVDLDGAVVANDFPTYVFGDRIDLEFANWVFRSDYFRQQSIARSAGSTNRKKMRRSEFLNLEIPVPGLEVQRQIAGKLHYLDTEISTVRARVAQALEQTRVMWRGLMNELAPWPNAAT